MVPETVFYGKKNKNQNVIDHVTLAEIPLPIHVHKRVRSDILRTCIRPTYPMLVAVAIGGDERCDI